MTGWAMYGPAYSAWLVGAACCDSRNISGGTAVLCSAAPSPLCWKIGPSVPHRCGNGSTPCKAAGPAPRAYTPALSRRGLSTCSSNAPRSRNAASRSACCCAAARARCCVVRAAARALPRIRAVLACSRPSSLSELFADVRSSATSEAAATSCGLARARAELVPARPARTRACCGARALLRCAAQLACAAGAAAALRGCSGCCWTPLVAAGSPSARLGWLRGLADFHSWNFVWSVRGV